MPRKKATPASKKAVITTEIVKPEAIKVKPFTFLGKEGLNNFSEENQAEIGALVRKFQGRYGVRLSYIAKFKAFKLLRGVLHVDWITLNDLMKRYDCRIAPVAVQVQIQRPYKNNRVY
jgi:hypothetical protein